MVDIGFTFRTNEAKLAFLSQPFNIKDVEIEVQLIENPIVPNCGGESVVCS
jgi:hypothetical protein